MLWFALLFPVIQSSGTKLSTEHGTKGQCTSTCSDRFAASTANLDIFKTQTQTVEGSCWGRGGFRTYDISGMDECLPPHNSSSCPRVFIVGDSHSYVIRYGLARSSSRPVYGYGCSHDQSSDCIPKVIERLESASLGKNDIVGMAFNFDGSNPLPVDKYIQYANKMKEVAAHKQARLVLFDDYPALPNAACPLSLQCDSTLVDVRKTQEHWRAAVAQIGVPIIDLASRMCPNNKCTKLVPGTNTIAYIDYHHLSGAGSDYVASYICSQLPA